MAKQDEINLKNEVHQKAMLVQSATVAYSQARVSLQNRPELQTHVNFKSKEVKPSKIRS